MKPVHECDQIVLEPDQQFFIELSQHTQVTVLIWSHHQMTRRNYA